MLHKISTGVVTKSPDSARAYLLLMRLDRPTGYVLYLLPGLWAVVLASGRRPDLLTVVVVAVAAVLVRGAACAVNDVVDKEVDARVARTVSRPVASGTISVGNALLFAAAQGVVALLILAVANVETALVAGASYPLIVAYPYMKRIFFWPTAFLALVMSVYVLIGWTAVTGSFDYPLEVYCLYAGGAFWTLIHDAIYSHQDKEYDRNIGVKSSALLFGEATKVWLAIFGVVSVGGVLWAGSQASIGWAFYLIVVGAAIFLSYLVVRVDLDDPKSCWDAFVANTYFGWIILAAVVAGQFT
ncbi:4-hydroxybenzoate octaprenyltransferase [Streptomyces samsunensis]|nr:4-hydroxybenzoate polyprenyltransferase [Streptomyces autolyticus]AUA10718.1 4-hydroxybenzoate octaprenyltransferase [Streptomyces sp. M56]MYU12882.1 4-hydroxybenzoate octaprenyltransferase [Streptomyces sp. SID8361]MYX60403.1 4-hydroxybenzoate octaprenyltransferase [Streptomyces sp. SID8382]NUH40089.1 4-hydroxybenzoate octaprenyltransferase [Streptomyces samsunensis]QDL70329.1 4-hydroxybenzoate octaprenyltransferase [Streptomyces malaysiensis]SCF95909.1 4-hydroxybenzoate polyprenyltransfe